MATRIHVGIRLWLDSPNWTSSPLRMDVVTSSYIVCLYTEATPEFWPSVPKTGPFQLSVLFAHPKDQNEGEIKKIWRKIRETTGKWGKSKEIFISWRPGSEKLVTTHKPCSANWNSTYFYPAQVVTSHQFSKWNKVCMNIFIYPVLK